MKAIVATIMIACLWSCSGTKIRVPGDVKVIDMAKVQNAGGKSNTSYVQDVEYIPLMSDKDNLVGEIDRILFVNNRFYLFDFTISQTVMVFDRKGKFIYKINKRGNGPGEYVSISDFDVDSEGNIYVFDAASRRLIKYMDEGNKYEIIKLPVSFVEFKFISDNDLVAFLPFSKVGIEGAFGLIDIEKEEYSSLLPIRENIDLNQHFYELSHLFKSGKNVFFSPRFTNRIYKIEKNKAEEMIRFSNDVLPPDDFISRLLTDRNLFLKNDQYILSIMGVYQTDNDLLVSFRQSLNNSILLLTDNDIIRIDRIKGCNYMGNNEILGCAGNKYISVIRLLNPNDVSNSCLSEEIKSRLASGNNSNPLLVLFCFNHKGLITK